MKHLKTFENINTVYKKYAVWMKLDTNTFNLIEITDDSDVNVIKFKVLYTYNKNGDVNIIPKIKKPHIFYKEYAKKRIIFSSDNIEECKEQIRLLSTANKFNL
jgi:hypothetical protein